MAEVSIQWLLNLSARLGNKGDHELETVVLDKIREVRGSEPPVCFGLDDCSSIAFIKCPWRMDCGN